jgi:arylsulfatase A-like enzyme
MTDYSDRVRAFFIAPVLLGLAAVVLLPANAGFGAPAATGAVPNIVYILADDLGYGDVKALNPQGKIATPSLDRLAGEGIAFTDAHSSSAVCTPSRYSILTGRYNWRSRLKSGVLSGNSSPLIEPGRLTVAEMLREYGYSTACIGKWHLGLEWSRGGPNSRGTNVLWQIDYTGPVRGGPVSVGFDTFFGIAASLDMPPFVYIENERCVGVPTVEKSWVRRGPAEKDFEAVDVLPTLTRKAVGYIDGRAAMARKGQPFFLYLALNSPHTPIVPTPEWRGKSGINNYADFVMETDWSVGAVLQVLETNGLTTNTLVIFASDNGCSPSANFPQLASHGHNPSYHFRGAKADIFDGGHRIPFLARWPGRISRGAASDQMVCLVDLMATCADILNVKLPANAGEDSVSLLPAMEGRAKEPLREAVVHHSINGSFSIRQGNWKLELCPDSGGWSAPRPNSPAAAGLPPIQLYDLATDIGETNNVQAQHPEIVERLTRLLESYVQRGRSTPGAAQTNTTAVNIFRGTKGKTAPATREDGD